jgi:hypothetical protein
MSGPNTYIYKVKGISLSERKDPHTGKKRKPQTLFMAARHNLREIQAENGADYGKLDPTKTYLNEVLAGPKKASEVVNRNLQLFAGAGKDPAAPGKDPAKLRKDHVQASEHVLSLAPGQEERGFFSVIVECFEGLYGAENILSATVHRDQDQPHIHILVSPIKGGKYHGGKLHNNIQTNQNKAQIAKAVKPIGFAPPATWRVKKHQINEKEAAVIAYLEHHQHPVLNDPAWPAWSKMIGNDPNHLFDFYKLDSESTPKTMSQERLTKSMGIAVKAPKTRNLPSVGIDQPQRPNTPPALAHHQPTGINYGQINKLVLTNEVTQRASALEEKSNGIEQIIRVRDSDLMPENYDPETGEYYSPPPARLSARQQADRWVSDALGKST